MDAAALETNIYAAAQKKKRKRNLHQKRTESMDPKRESLSRWSRFLCNEW